MLSDTRVRSLLLPSDSCMASTSLPLASCTSLASAGSGGVVFTLSSTVSLVFIASVASSNGSVCAVSTARSWLLPLSRQPLSAWSLSSGLSPDNVFPRARLVEGAFLSSESGPRGRSFGSFLVPVGFGAGPLATRENSISTMQLGNPSGSSLTDHLSASAAVTSRRIWTCLIVSSFPIWMWTRARPSRTITHSGDVTCPHCPLSIEKSVDLATRSSTAASGPRPGSHVPGTARPASSLTLDTLSTIWLCIRPCRLAMSTYFCVLGHIQMRRGCAPFACMRSYTAFTASSRHLACWKKSNTCPISTTGFRLNIPSEPCLLGILVLGLVHTLNVRL